MEVTTYRAEWGYADRRRPDGVRFGVSLHEDLSRRDFTMNAMAWVPEDLPAGLGRLVDPFGGLADLRDRILRAVGDPVARFGEDALRVLRAVRFSARFGLAMEPATERALVEAVPTVGSLSGERVRDELLRLLGDPAIRPSAAMRRWDELGLLRRLLPEVAELRGVPQGKPLAGDALDHSLATADALPAADPVLRLVGLLHDVGKATTFSAGRFIGHEVVGAGLTESIMRRLRFATADIERAAHLVRHHMFGYEPEWTDAAVRRFMRRVGEERLDDLLDLRQADAKASAADAPGDGLVELRDRIAAQAGSPIHSRQLAIDGHDLMRELGLDPGPRVGKLLSRLLQAVVEDPSLNEPDRLLELARGMGAGR